MQENWKEATKVRTRKNIGYFQSRGEKIPKLLGLAPPWNCSAQLNGARAAHATTSPLYWPKHTAARTLVTGMVTSQLIQAHPSYSLYTSSTLLVLSFTLTHI